MHGCHTCARSRSIQDRCRCSTSCVGRERAAIVAWRLWQDGREDQRMRVDVSYRPAGRSQTGVVSVLRRTAGGSGARSHRVAWDQPAAGRIRRALGRAAVHRQSAGEAHPVIRRARVAAGLRASADPPRAAKSSSSFRSTIAPGMRGDRRGRGARPATTIRSASSARAPTRCPMSRRNTRRCACCCRCC